jgi:hypothetical protein
MRVSINAKGDLKRTKDFLLKMSKGDLFRNLDGLAQEGVAALSAATPKDSGGTANSWSYEVKVGLRSSTITWMNTHTENGFPVALMLQYGHGTGTGGWVSGRDYINPTIKPVFDKIADEAWKVVISA